MRRRLQQGQMQVVLALFAVIGFLLPLGGPSAETAMPLSLREALPLQSSATGEWTLFPASDSWVNVEPSVVGVIFPVGSRDVDPKNSILTIDEQVSQLRWGPGNGTLWASPALNLGEGPHTISVEVVERGGAAFPIVWTFHLDTTRPILLILPLPKSVPEQTVVVAGEVTERNLETVTVNEVVTPVNGLGQFEISVPLWPGPNDILVRATDRAENTEEALRIVTRNSGESEPPSLQEFRHETSSFTIELPSNWSILPDPFLETGGMADVVALGPTADRSRPSISIVSGLAAPDWTADDLLTFMQEAVANLSRDHQITVISRPHIVNLDSSPSSLAGQFSLVQDDGEENATFLFASYVWNGFLPRNWIILASGGTGEIADLWPLFAASTESFHVVGGEPQDDLGSRLQRLVAVVVPVAVAAAAFISVFFGVVLYLRHRRRERAAIGRSHEDS